MSKKTYFASDFHLGIDARLTSHERERQICQWLTGIQHDAESIYLVGDVFDQWFEYKTVIPKGYSRLFGKLAELRDGGIPIYFFTGNHDMWMFRYFEDEMGIPIYRQPITRTIGTKIFFIGHGDGLGPGDFGYKVLKKVLANPLCQWLYSLLHPNIALSLMRFFSSKSRDTRDPSVENQFLGPDKEWLIQYTEEKIKHIAVDYFIFGHRHLPIDWRLSNGHTRYINLGEWMHYNTYAAFDGNELSLQIFDNQNVRIFTNH